MSDLRYPDFEWVFVGRTLHDTDPDVLEAMHSDAENILVMGCDAADAPNFVTYVMESMTAIGEGDV